MKHHLSLRWVVVLITWSMVIRLGIREKGQRVYAFQPIIQSEDIERIGMMIY